MRHPNADVLIGLAEGRTVLARYLPRYSFNDEEFIPLNGQSSTALHALFKPAPGLELQGKWEFKLSEDES